MDTYAVINKVEKLKDIPLADFIKKNGYIDLFMAEQIKKAKDKEKAININQLRNFFNEIRKLKIEKEEFDLGIARIEMNLAYDYGRNVITKDFYDLTTSLLKKVKGMEDFDIFDEIVQALIAYFKLHSVLLKQQGGN
jgi:CRISPR type III-A-associated protein Csm2